MIKEALELLGVRLESYLENVKVFKEIIPFLPDKGKIWAMPWVDNVVIIEFDDLNMLKDYRRELKKIDGNYTDKLKRIFVSNRYLNEATARWEGIFKGYVIEIDLIRPIESFPEELKRDGCGFKELTETFQSYVCEGK